MKYVQKIFFNIKFDLKIKSRKNYSLIRYLDNFLQDIAVRSYGFRRIKPIKKFQDGLLINFFFLILEAIRNQVQQHSKYLLNLA